MTSSSFKMKRRSIASMFLSSIFAIAVLYSCKKEAHTSSSGYYINESEKLVIPASIDLPANLPGGNSRVATYYAKGVQKYKSQIKAGSNPVAYEWVFVSPQADLYDASNKKVGTHSAGPTWQLFGGADSIYGQPFNPPRSAPSPGPYSINWLLLMPKTGKTPTGVFANVSYIQRIATKGGKAPTELPMSGGTTVEVEHTSVYRFTQKNQ